MANMSLSAQVKVLRALKESVISRFGSDKDIKSEDVKRFVASIKIIDIQQFN